MQILKRLLDFYIQSSIHVGLAVLCLVHITVFSNDLVKHSFYPSCVFFGTIAGYNFLKYFQVFTKNKFYSKKFYGIVAISLLAIVGFVYCYFLLNAKLQIHILISGLFVLLYPFLRKFGWLKLFLVSFVVTYITVFIPFQTDKYSISELYLNVLQRFLIIISLLIPFEIMDSKTDNKSLDTLPQKFGIDSTKLFGTLLVIPFIILQFLKLQPSYIVLPIGIITVLLINFTTLERSKYYTSFWVESVPIFWLILLILFQ
jgi:hypothetical protein